MKLSLVIQVYNGGDYWRECWESVIENQDIFEHIFISISKSPKQEEDIALVRDSKLEKLRWIRQDENLTSVQHMKFLDRWVRSFHPTGRRYYSSVALKIYGYLTMHVSKKIMKNAEISLL